MKPYEKENMTKEEKRAIKILETTTAKIGNHYEVGLFGKRAILF